MYAAKTAADSPCLCRLCRAKTEWLACGAGQELPAEKPIWRIAGKLGGATVGFQQKIDESRLIGEFSIVSTDVFNSAKMKAMVRFRCVENAVFSKLA
jgi:hypothetical protein